MEEKTYPGSSYQPLFDYLTKEHGLTLLESEMNDLIEVVHKFHPAGAVWVKASERLPAEGKQVFAQDDSGRKTTGYFTRSNLASTSVDTFYSMVGGFYIKGKEYESIEWLDESGAPAADWAKDYDTLYYIVMPVLNKLRHRTDNDTRMMEMGSDIRNTIHKVLADIKKLPPPISSGEPPFLIQSEKAPAAGREEDAEKAQFGTLNKWLSEGGYSFDGEYYYDDENNFFTPDQIWERFKQQKEK